MTGTLYLVGTGPGDPELLTLKAARILGAVDVIAYPQKQREASLSFSIAKTHLNPKAELLPIDVPMAIERTAAQTAYDHAAEAIRTRLAAGKSVAYLCEGDPLFYGSAMYLIDRAASFADIVVVPGVTSLTASAAVIVRPLAARNEVLKILPAPLDDARLLHELETAEAVAIVKLGRHFDRIRALLETAGWAENAVIIEHATGPDERVTRLREFASDARPYFSTILCYRGNETWGTRP